MDRRVLAVARGDEPADLVLSGGRIVNVFTAEASVADVALVGNRIAAVAPKLDGRTRHDVSGAFVVPGLIDAHVHLESSLVTPAEFARAVVPRGTTAVVSDPHELANVAGIHGIRWMLEASAGLPLTVFVNASSCVPATKMATAGARLEAVDLTSLLDHDRVLGLAEVMNVPGVVLGDAEVHAKLDAFANRPVDGHAPGLGGPWLQAYLAAGVRTDHESMSSDEALEKLRLGMRVWIRESTGAKNLKDLLPAVTPANSRRCGFCTDDRHPYDLEDDGHLDHLVRLAIAAGIDPIQAIQMATLNVAEFYRLDDRGAIAPGYLADLVVVDDLAAFAPSRVYAAGKLVAREGKPVEPWEAPDVDSGSVRGVVRIDSAALDLKIADVGAPARVIGMVPDQIITTAETCHLPAEEGWLLADSARGIAKLAVVERHTGSGRVGLGFLRGLGIKRGALAGTVAHDHHNLVVAGMDDSSMKTAVAALADVGGGLAVADGQRVLGLLPLPICGLLSDQPLAEVRRTLDALIAAARVLGCSHPDPFMALGFMALEVIPELKLTDRGLVDVRQFEVVPLWWESGPS